MTPSILRRTVLASAAGLLLAFFSASQPAAAQAQSVSFTVRVILASDSGSGVAPELQSEARRLTQQFSQFSGFDLVSDHSITLGIDQVEAISLPGDQRISIKFLGVAHGGYRFDITVPGGSTVATFPPGGLLFIAGPQLPGGTAILAFRADD